ncbi:MAG: long-chain fatty acid--CoA ligase [Promethearchaeota archaeon]|nr:MAG: long-chain fatty acid--CoA ligase [Candidatus Lokiarchaeota archaeon]
MIFIKDYSEWKPIIDYENDSPYVNLNRPWLKYRPSTVAKTIRFDPIPLSEFIRLSVSKFPNNVFLYHKPTDKKYTYRELLHYADKIANALSELGVSKGDAVGVMSINCPEFIFCFLGIIESGATVVPINPLLKESDVTHIIREAGNIKAIFAHKANYRTIKKAGKEVEIKNLILLGTQDAKPDTITLEEFINGSPPKPPSLDIDPSNDIAALMFTGGTTGLPKGVMLTHDNIIHSALSMLYMAEEEIEENIGNGVGLSILPLCHVFGFEIMICTFYLVPMMVMFDSFNPAEILEAIEYYKIKLFVGVPVMFQMLINHPDFTERDLSSIERTASGSAALAPELADRWEKVVGPVGQGFGMTETSSFSHTAAGWMPETIPASIGVPIIDTDAKIVNPDNLEELPPNEIGELLIKGPQIMKGYWKNPEATKQDIVDGWLRTGDLARMDERGYFYIEGRTKDMIKYKGYKVMAREVEEKLMEHPAILEAGAIGVPDPNIGETIKAFIVLKSEYRDGKVNESDIINWAKEKLAGYKYPRKVEFLRSLPRTAVGKIFRRKLREMESEKQ